MDFSSISFENLTAASSIAACLFLAVLYVGSLYVWTSNLPRDHPQTIKERIRRVVFTSIISIIIVVQMSDKIPGSDAASLHRWLGIHTDSIISAFILPLLLFIILFLGPLYLEILEEGFGNLYPKRWKYYLKDLRWWRNYFVAPFSEELVFRGCMLPMLLPVFGGKICIILAPSFFGIAHIHHAWEKYYKGRFPLRSVILGTVFQAFYTTLFGGLSSWLFLRTGHLSSAVICHSFCNLMGFPDFPMAMEHEKRIQICTAFVVGLVLFLVLANPLTDPSMYGNTLYANVL